MAQTPSTWDDYVGDGVEDTFQVTFPYQKQQEVFVTVDGAPAAFTFISAGWIQLAAVPASGAAIRVQRSTEAFEPRHEFANGVPLLPRFIDENNKQFLYVAQEAINETVGTAAMALSQANQAVATADAAADLIGSAVQDSALYLRNDLANSVDPAKGAALVGFAGATVADALAARVTSAALSNAVDTNQGAAIIGRSGQVIGSIADLRLLDKAAASRHAFVTGYYAAGDGGGGAYYLDASDGVSVDNGGTVIVAVDGGRWKLTQSSRISVKQFGAKGDGVTIDDSAINAALAYAESATGGAIHFPAGIYQVTQISWDIQTLSKTGRRVALTGDGPALSVIRSNSTLTTAGAAVLVDAKYETAMNSLISGVEFSNLGFELQTSGGAAFRVRAMAYCNFVNCHFNGGQYAFFGEGLLSSSFTNCRFSDAADTGLRLQKGTGFSFPNAITLTQCVIGDNGKYGIYADNPGGLRMFGGSVEGNGALAVNGAGVVMDHAALSSGTAIAGAFYGVYFEFNNGLADVHLVHNNTGENVSLTVADCSFACGGAAIATDRILVEHISATALTLNVQGCNFQELAGFLPTVAQKYIRITGGGTGQRKCGGFGNYFNHPNSFPIPAQFREMLRSNVARVESFSGTANAAGEITFTFAPFQASPVVTATAVDTGIGVVAVKCIGRTTRTASFRAQFSSAGGGAWSPGNGMMICATVCGN